MFQRPQAPSDPGDIPEHWRSPLVNPGQPWTRHYWHPACEGETLAPSSRISLPMQRFPAVLLCLGADAARCVPSSIWRAAPQAAGRRTMTALISAHGARGVEQGRPDRRRRAPPTWECLL